MSLGLPSVNISFAQQGITAIQRGNRGIVALILKDSKSEEFTVYDKTDIPEGLKDENKEYISMALRGYSNAPAAIEIFTLQSTEIKVSEKLKVSDDVRVGDVESVLNNALNHLENINFDYLAYPEAGVSDVTEIASWVKSQREAGKMVSAVLGKVSDSDNEGIINFTTDNIKVGEKIYSASEFTARIAGLLAGCDLKMSITYAELKEIDDIPFEKKDSIEEKIGKGELVLFKENKKIKIARGVTSLITTNDKKGEKYKKIKLVALMDLMANDLSITCKENYIGKYSNSYDNKCLLVSAIAGYLDKLALDGLLEKSSINVALDLDEQKAYLKGNGVNLNVLTEREIKEYNTDDKVFIRIKSALIDSIEDIDIKFIV